MRVLPILALSAALLGTAGCTDPYGRVDYGRTALLGAGIGAAAGLVAGAAADQPRPYYGDRRGGRYYRDDYYGGGYRRGYYAPPPPPGWGYGRPRYYCGW
jgi:hypothetical protein